MSTFDEQVKALFEKLNSKKAEVANAERPVYITGGSFRYSESMHNVVDIITVREERKLVEILAFLNEREKNYDEAAKELGVNANFTWLGFTKDDWKKDIMTRVSILQLAKRKAELAELEKKLNGILSPELRAKMELEYITTALG